MIVVDASAMVEALIGRDVDEGLLEALGGAVAAPHLVDGATSCRSTSPRRLVTTISR